MQTDVCLVYCCMRVQKGKHEAKEAKEAHPAGAGRAEGGALLNQGTGGSHCPLCDKRVGKNPGEVSLSKHQFSHNQNYLRVV